MPDDGQDGSDHDDGFDKASGLAPDFMSKLRAAGERVSAKPDPWHQVATEQAKLREEMQELKGQLRAIQAGLGPDHAPSRPHNPQGKSARW